MTYLSHGQTYDAVMLTVALLSEPKCLFQRKEKRKGKTQANLFRFQAQELSISSTNQIAGRVSPNVMIRV